MQDSSGAESPDAAPPAAPWLSLLLPVFDIAPYLGACVESIVRDAPPGVEVLLLDDGSRDGSLQLAQRLAQAHPGLRVLANPGNRGIACTRNRLLAEARGEYVWFVDGDDLLAPGVLPRLHDLLRRQPGLDVLLCDYRVLRERPRWRHRLRGEGHRRGFAGPSRQRVEGEGALLQGLLATGNVFVWTQVVRRALWQGLAFPEGRAFEDMATVPRLLLRARSGWHEPEPWIVYRRREGSITAVMSAARVADLSASLRGVMPAQAPPALAFWLAHQAARNLLAAQRHARRLPAAQAQALWPTLRADFLQAAGEQLPALWRGYLRRGWLWRALRLRAALAQDKP